MSKQNMLRESLKGMGRWAERKNPFWSEFLEIKTTKRMQSRWKWALTLGEGFSRFAASSSSSFLAKMPGPNGWESMGKS
jgi:hypothetical protein